MRTIILYLLLVLLFNSCKQLPTNFSTVSDGLSYLSDPVHGFVQDTVLHNKIKVQVQLIPSSLVQKSNDAGKQKYVVIRFSYQGRELLAQLPREQYGSYVQLFSFGMDNKIKILTTSGKIYTAIMVSYQPTYNIGRSSELLAVFGEDIPLTEDVELQIEEFGLNLGILKFRFTSDQLKYKPHIDHI